MKSPRELLLNKHRTAGSKLDEVRREVVNDCRRRREESLTEHSAFDQSHLTSAPIWDGWLSLPQKFLVKGWQELFVSCRRAWMGLAAVWGVILALNLTSSETTVQTAKGPAPKAEEVIASLQENKQRIMAELGVASLKPEIAEPRDPAIRPRSERAQPVAMA